MSRCLPLLIAAAVLLMVAAGCSSNQPPPVPQASTAAPNRNEPMPSPKQMEREEIEGINKNPKLDASDKASYILQIKKQFAYLNAQTPGAKSPAGKPTDGKKKAAEAKKSGSGV